MIEIDLVDFVLRGTIGPFSAQTNRDDIVSVLGPPDQPSYPTHVLYGNLCFDLAGGIGPLGLVQIAIPHEAQSICPHPDWAKTWTPPIWLKTWPDHRVAWKLGPFVPNATMTDIQNAIPELQELKPEEPLWVGQNDKRFHLLVPTSNVYIEFESLQKDAIKTLSWLIGPPRGWETQRQFM